MNNKTIMESFESNSKSTSANNTDLASLKASEDINNSFANANNTTNSANANSNNGDLRNRDDEENKFEPVMFTLDQSLSTSEENTLNSSASSECNNKVYTVLNSSMNATEETRETYNEVLDSESHNVIESIEKTGEHFYETNVLNRNDDEILNELKMELSNSSTAANNLTPESDKSNRRVSHHSTNSINISNNAIPDETRNSNSSTEMNSLPNDSFNKSSSAVSNSSTANLGKNADDNERSSFASANNSFNNEDGQRSTKKPSPNNSATKSDKSKKPWYSAFTNTYKQKNLDFKKLFKLKPEEHLLVDYSCALQREILAHGRLYISLNYVCFRANIIGWETTLILKLKDIRSIIKDKTAKIIPNAITIILDNEKYFFTSFAARDKTYTTLFRVWQIALADASMSPDEINNILKTSYGEDLGYNSDDADYEYYSKLKSKEQTPEFKFYKNPIASSTVEISTTNSESNFATNRDSTAKNISNISSSDSSSSSPLITKEAPNFLTSTYLNATNTEHDLLTRTNLGHRQTSSFDASLIDTSNNERPRSMVVNKHQMTATSAKATLSSLPVTSPTSAVPITKNQSNLNELRAESPSNGKILDLESSNNINNNNILSDDENGNYNTITNGNNNQLINDSSKFPDSLNASTSVLISSSPIQNESAQSSDASSSSESEESDDEEIEYPAKCSCVEHQGKEMLNQVFNLSVNYLWESLFGHTEFCRKYWESRKFGNFKITDWKAVNTFVMRQLDYTVDLGTIGRPKNTEDQKIIEYRPNVCIVIESESATHGVPYSDCFTVRNRFCITKVTSTKTRLSITSYINYLQKPNFIAKSFIERNCMGALKDSYNYLANLIDKEYVNCAKFCHEFISATQLDNCLLKISATTNSTHKDNTNAGNDGSFTLSYVNNQIIREKTIPKIVQPNNIPVHISAVTSATSTSLLSKNNLSGKSLYSATSSNTLLTSNINTIQNSTIETNENTNNNNNTSTPSRPTSNGSKYPGSTSVRKRITRNSQSNDFQNLNEASNESNKFNAKIQPQLVPIQKFSFYKWEINVDTLVRLFIVAMVCLMVINGMLYFKLRRIETLADGLRSDPNVLAKISNQQLMQQKHYENKLNENSLLSDLHGWRDVISNTLNVIEKMETSLKEWDKSLEKRQTEKDLNSVLNDMKSNKNDV